LSGEPVEISIDLVGDGLRLAAHAGSNAPVYTDSPPPFGGGEGYTPTELFLISLATCSGSTIVSLLRKKRKTVVSFKMKAEGFKREAHPKIFEKVILRCELVSPDATDEDMRRCIELTEEKYCPVWGMVRGNVRIECDYIIKQYTAI
jgi:putative redox protein